MPVKLQIDGDKEGPIYARIARAVCEAVASGRLKSGDTLPTESALAGQLQINRLTVSRAYEHLQSEKIITQKPGSGTFVAPDASYRVRQHGTHPPAVLAIVLGEDALSKCLREELFIGAEILDGIQGVFGRERTRFTFLESFTRPSLEGITADDAVVIINPKECDATLVVELQAAGVPMVSVWGDWTSATIPRVVYDRYHSASLACQHLVGCGYRRIGYIGNEVYPERHTAPPPPLLAVRSPKFVAFTTVLLGAGIDVCSSVVSHK